MMASKLFEVVREGNLNGLLELLKENPDILEDVAVMSAETPLHIASKLGHSDVVREILLRKPELAKELNQDGYSALHLASAIGHTTIVKMLSLVDPNLFLVKDKFGRTPIYYATMKGNINVIKELGEQASYLESDMDLTWSGETPLHVAVLYNQIDAFDYLIAFLQRINKMYYVNTMDHHGSSVLHLATSRKQLKILETLLKEETGITQHVNVNASNAGGFTALDILDVLPPSHGDNIDKEIEYLLQQAGALRSRDMNLSTYRGYGLEPGPNPVTSASMRTMYELIVELRNSEMRRREKQIYGYNKILLIAALIATITFLATFVIAGDSWQHLYELKCSTNATSQIKNQNPRPELAELSIPRHKLVSWFILFNTAGFFTSTAMILRMLVYLPFKLLSLISVFALLGSYICTVIAISPDEVQDVLIIAIPIASLASASYILPNGIMTLLYKIYFACKYSVWSWRSSTIEVQI